MLAEGVCVYDAKAHPLNPVAPGDHRAQAGTQASVATAPVNLVYAADLGRRATLASWLGIIAVSVLFGYGHYHKGPAGIVDSGIAGVLLSPQSGDRGSPVVSR